MQKDDKTIICKLVGVLEQGDMQKAVSKRWCKENRSLDW